MCEALPPTLEKNIMDLGGYVAICRYIVFWHLGPHFGVLVALWKTLWRLFSTLGDLGAPFCHPWGSVVAPGGPFCHPWRTFGRLFVGLEWPWGSIVVSLGSIWAPLGHFGSLSGKRCEKCHKWTSNWTSKWDGFRCIFDIFIILWVLWRELGGHLFLGIFLAVFSGIPGSGIWSWPQFLLCQTHITYLGADTAFLSLWFHRASILEAAGLLLSVFWSPLRALAACVVATMYLSTDHMRGLKWHSRGKISKPLGGQEG